MAGVLAGGGAAAGSGLEVASAAEEAVVQIKPQQVGMKLRTRKETL